MLLSSEERQAFSSLSSDLDRERFIEGVWQRRRAPARRRFAANRVDADLLRPRSSAEREALLLAGKPRDVYRLEECSGDRRELVLWTYPAWRVERQSGRQGERDVALLFVQTKPFDPRTLRLWSAANDALDPRSGEVVSEFETSPFSRATAEQCIQRPELGRWLKLALESAPGRSELIDRFGWPRPPASLEQDSRVGAAERSDVDEVGAPALSARATLLRELRPGIGLPGTLDPRIEIGGRFLGALGSGALFEGTLSLPSSLIARAQQGMVLDRFELLGDVLRGNRRIDTFEHTFHVAGAEPSTEEVQLRFYRLLQAGHYRLKLRFAGRLGRALLRDDVELSVPSLSAAPPDAVGQDYTSLVRSEAMSMVTFPRIEILPPATRPAGERVGVDAVTVGGPVSAVELGLDGRWLARAERPPYRAELALGKGRHQLMARAFDRGGRVVAEDTLAVEQRDEGLALRLSLVSTASERIARADLSLPSGSRVSRFECYWNRQLQTSLTLPPWRCPVPEISTEPLPYVRAVVTLLDGRSDEDILFYTDRKPEHVDVAVVELLFSAIDRFGRPLTDLASRDVKVLIGGREQPVVALNALHDLPISVALLMDVSSSLGRRVRAAAQSAQELFEELLRERDLASLLLFNQDVRLSIPFTNDIQELRYGASGLRAFGSTRLFDGIGYTLFTFAETRNRRALIVVSDGADTGSDLSFERVLEEATRARVAVYPIALGTLDQETATHLEALARRTGGRLLHAATVEELAEVYHRIVNELRSQYSVVYRPEDAGSLPDLSRVRVQVERPDAEVRYVRGTN